MAVSACVSRFIVTVLCGNPILKGAFITFLNGTVAQLDQEITVLTASLGRLNVVQALTNIEIQAVNAIVNKIRNDANLLLGPLNSFSGCSELQRVSSYLQNNAGSKAVKGFQRKVYELNRAANMANVQSSIIQAKEQLKQDVLDILDEINTLCP